MVLHVLKNAKIDKIKIVFISLYFVLVSLCVFGQQKINSRFNYLVSPNYELRSNAITSIVQDDAGIIWIGSRKGLFQYNGNDYKEVISVNRYLDTPFKQDIYVLHFDVRGWLWIGTQSGLVVYDPKSAQILSFPGKLLNDNIVNGISSTENGDVIIAIHQKLFAYIASEDRIEDITPTIQEKKKNKALRFYSICQTNDTCLWVSSSIGLCQFKGENSTYKLKEFYDYEELYSGSIANHRDILLLEDNNGDLLVGTYDGFFKFSIDLLRLEPYLDKVNTPPYKNIRALTLDRENRLWIGTMSGVLIGDSLNLTTISYNPEQTNSLSDDRIRSIYIDRNNTIWIGTYFGGVNYWNDRNIEFFYVDDKRKNGLSDKTINCIAEDQNGMIYFGTENYGVTSYNSLTGEYRNLEKIGKSGSSPVINMFCDDNDKLWMGTIRDGLVCYNTQTDKQRVYMPKLERSSKVIDYRILSKVKQSDTLFWVSIKLRGLHKFNPLTGVFKQVIPTGTPNKINTISHIEKDHSGNLWCATSGHLYVMNIDSAKQGIYHFNEVLTEIGKGLQVNDIYTDKNNAVWIGGANNLLFKHTETGLNKIDIGDNVSIFSIVAGEGDDIWLSSSIGVIQLDALTNKFKVFDSRHGLQINAFCDNSGIRSSNGNIYFGGTSGVTYFNPATSVNETLDSASIIITDLLVYNKPVAVGDDTGILSQSIEYTDELKLHHTQNMFAIKFAYEDFGYTARYNFEYRLKGLSDKWIQTNTPMVAYTLQTGGDYVFEVRYLNPDGVPVSKIKRLYITLKNPFWKTGWAYLLYVSILFLILGGVFYLYRSRMKLDFQLQMELAENERQKQIHEQKLNLFTNISHDFRTPLTLIVGAVDQFITKYSLSHEMYRVLSSVQKNTNQLLSLINDLMDFQKIENRQMHLQVYESNIVDFVREIFLSFKIQADIKKLNYNFTSSDSDITVFFDPVKMERVIYNLLSNAFKFTDTGGDISVHITQRNNVVEISIKDSGCGIAPENRKYVFERFYEKNNQNNSFGKGTGIGLSITKSIVELHKGTITFDSTLNVGTTFTISLLKGSAHFDTKELLKKEPELDRIKQVQWNETLDDKRKIDSIVEDTWRKNDKEYSVLIAEDNEELGLYLKDSLSSYFNVTLAENGQAAYKNVLNDPPDLIISDVMMPVMDGIEFCKKIKTTTETSHIPFVLLTARTSLIYKYEGLESGADEYLNKPFQLKELLLKCINMLNIQESLRHKFLQKNELSIDKTEVSNTDKDLFEKAMQLLNKNVGNEFFGVQDLCLELGLSRSVLYTKVKDWTDQSPGELLLGFRMKHAAKLLEQQQYTISQIASMVGYKRANYFSKSFKNYHKLTPSEYIKKFC